MDERTLLSNIIIYVSVDSLNMSTGGQHREKESVFAKEIRFRRHIDRSRDQEIHLRKATHSFTTSHYDIYSREYHFFFINRL